VGAIRRPSGYDAIPPSVQNQSSDGRSGCALSTLRIHHVPGEGESRFYVQRLPGGKTTKPAAISAPADFPVEGRSDSNLVRELRWYLEEFLGYPFPPGDRTRQARP
jgi:hypothetical protein